MIQKTLLGYCLDCSVVLILFSSLTFFYYIFFLNNIRRGWTYLFSLEHQMLEECLIVEYQTFRSRDRLVGQNLFHRVEMYSTTGHRFQVREGIF